MSEYEEQVDEAEIDGQNEATGGSGGEPRLYAGKYKTVEEMEQAHDELQRTLGRQSKAVGQIKGLGYAIDEDGNVIQPTQYQEPVTNYTQPEPTEQDPNSIFWENPQAATMSVYQQLNRQTKMAAANLRMQMAQRQNDPVFNSVRAEYEAQLMSLDDSLMADPRAAAYYGESLFNMVVGQKARQMASQGREDPSVRKRLLQELGVESPQASTEKSSGDEINEKDKRMLGELGLDATGRKAVVEKWSTREDE